jgi:hypothetical protein
MLRIQDLPEGGGADGGRQVWFKVVTEDGNSQVLALSHGQVQHFISGLQRFADVARQQRAQLGLEAPTSPDHAYLVERVDSFPAPGHNLMLRLGVGKDVDFSFFLRPQMLKALLKSILHIQEGPPAAPPPKPKGKSEAQKAAT